MRYFYIKINLMKKSANIVITFIFLIFQYAVCIAAPDKPQEIKAPITSVKVCLNVAQITHSQKIKIKPGINKLAFFGLASNVSYKNISLRNTGSGELLSLRLIKMTDTSNILLLNEDFLPVLSKAKDSLLILEKNIERLGLELQGLEIEKKMLLKNSEVVSSSRAPSFSELKQTNEYFRERFKDVNLDILSRQRELKQLKRSKVRTLKSAFDIDISEEGNMSISIILAEIKNPDAEYSTDIELSYLAKEAGWIPVYDIFSTNGKSLKMNYRAKVLNNTGADWNNINVTLSTADPFQYYMSPDLSPMYGSSRNRNEENSDKQRFHKNNIEVEEILIPDREINFNLSKSYTFKSGYTPWFVDITAFELQPEYLYRTAPKKEEQVYSIARIKDWEKLNLLDGEGNIYNNGMFLGKTYLRPGEVEDYLELPLGVVDNIFVKHKLVNEFSGKKIFGGNTVATFNYEIKVKNISGEKVLVEVLDQAPVSDRSSVKTDLIEMTDGGDKDDATGKIVWKLEMNPANEKILSLKYSVSYPSRSYTFSHSYRHRAVRAKF